MASEVRTDDITYGRKMILRHDDLTLHRKRYRHVRLSPRALRSVVAYMDDANNWHYNDSVMTNPDDLRFGGHSCVVDLPDDGAGLELA